ncbi:MAG TPA: YraN family protein [Treponemataceae bacterium]|nr:YraN family protein [Treponemataceae bacterium]
MQKLKSTPLSTSEKGKKGEERAVRYLVEKNYEILEQNWRTRKGEIDIIAKQDECVIFVEVKTIPKGNIDTLSRLLDKQKQEKILKTAKYYLENNRQYSNYYIRFDVLVMGLASLEEVYHIENAFLE